MMYANGAAMPIHFNDSIFDSDYITDGEKQAFKKLRNTEVIAKERKRLLNLARTRRKREKKYV